MKHIPRLGILCICLLLTFTALPIQAQDHPEQTAIDEVNRLGRMIYDYDQAAWHGTDAVLPLLQENQGSMGTTVKSYVVEQTEEGMWRVMFGRLTPDSTGYEIAFEAKLDTAYGVSSTIAYEQGEIESGFPADAGKALALAKQNFQAPQQVTYNTVALPVTEDSLYVYLLPAPPAKNVFFIGSDRRYTYDTRRGTLAGSKQLHQSMLTMDLRRQPEMITISTAVLTAIPTETDVFFAISRPAETPSAVNHYVMTGEEVFSLNQNGVTGHMTREEWNAKYGDPEQH